MTQSFPVCSNGCTLYVGDEYQYHPVCNLSRLEDTPNMTRILSIEDKVAEILSTEDLRKELISQHHELIDRLESENVSNTSDSYNDIYDEELFRKLYSNGCFNKDKNIVNIYLKIDVDGFTLKSSRKSMVLMHAVVLNMDSADRNATFQITILPKASNKTNFDSFLKPIIDELQQLSLKTLHLTNDDGLSVQTKVYPIFFNGDGIECNQLMSFAGYTRLYYEPIDFFLKTRRALNTFSGACTFGINELHGISNVNKFFFDLIARRYNKNYKYAGNESAYPFELSNVDFSCVKLGMQQSRPMIPAGAFQGSFHPIDMSNVKSIYRSVDHIQRLIYVVPCLVVGLFGDPELGAVVMGLSRACALATQREVPKADMNAHVFTFDFNAIYDRIVKANDEDYLDHPLTLDGGDADEVLPQLWKPPFRNPVYIDERSEITVLVEGLISIRHLTDAMKKYSTCQTESIYNMGLDVVANRGSFYAIVEMMKMHRTANYSSSIPMVQPATATSTGSKTYAVIDVGDITSTVGLIQKTDVINGVASLANWFYLISPSTAFDADMKPYCGLIRSRAILNFSDSPYRKFMLMAEVRYQKLRREAGLDEGTQLAVVFFFSLRDNVRSRSQVAIATHFGSSLPTSINQIIDLVLASGEDSGLVAPPSKRNRSESYQRTASSTSSSSQGNNKDNKMCIYCNKVTWFPGHRCPEFKFKKNASGPSKTSQMARRSDNFTNVDNINHIEENTDNQTSYWKQFADEQNHNAPIYLAIYVDEIRDLSEHGMLVRVNGVEVARVSVHLVMATGDLVGVAKLMRHGGGVASRFGCTSSCLLPLHPSKHDVCYKPSADELMKDAKSKHANDWPFTFDLDPDTLRKSIST
ncbi:hypothetical protein MBANPS3_010440 [Mucor bainieri]